MTDRIRSSSRLWLRARMRARRHVRLGARLNLLTIVTLLLVSSLAPTAVAVAQEATPAGTPVTASSLCLVSAGDTQNVSISGTVTEEGSGEPIQGVIVRARDIYGRIQLQATTTITGAYTIGSVYPGDWVVNFTTNGNAMTTPYVGEIHDQANSFGAATILHVNTGEHMTGIDAELALGAEISGKVTDKASGDPLANTSVFIYPADDLSSNLASVQTNASGEYHFRAGFAPGNYLLFFTSFDHESAWYDGVADDEDATPIALVGTQSRVVNISLTSIQPLPEGKITGRITIASNGNPVPGARVTPLGKGVYALDRVGTADAQGYYTLTVPVGVYELRAAQPTGFGDYAPRYLGPDATYTNAITFTVSANQTVTNKDIALEEGFYIEGTVSLPGGAPADLVFVSAYEGPGTLESGFSYSAQSDPDGHYSIGPLPRIPFTVSLTPPSRHCDLVSIRQSVNPDAAAAATVVESEFSTGVLLAGRVTNAATGAGMASVFVQAYNASGDTVTGRSSAETGYYILPAVAAGNYRVGFEEDGFADQFFDNKPTLATASVVAGTAGQGFIDINAALTVDPTGGGVENGVYVPFVMR